MTFKITPKMMVFFTTSLVLNYSNSTFAEDQKCLINIKRKVVCQYENDCRLGTGIGEDDYLYSKFMTRLQKKGYQVITDGSSAPYSIVPDFILHVENKDTPACFLIPFCHTHHLYKTTFTLINNQENSEISFSKEGSSIQRQLSCTKGGYAGDPRVDSMAHFQNAMDKIPECSQLYRQNFQDISETRTLSNYEITELTPEQFKSQLNELKRAWDNNSRSEYFYQLVGKSLDKNLISEVLKEARARNVNDPKLLKIIGDAFVQNKSKDFWNNVHFIKTFDHFGHLDKNAIKKIADLYRTRLTFTSSTNFSSFHYNIKEMLVHLAQKYPELERALATSYKELDMNERYVGENKLSLTELLLSIGSKDAYFNKDLILRQVTSPEHSLLDKYSLDEKTFINAAIEILATKENSALRLVMDFLKDDVNLYNQWVQNYLKQSVNDASNIRTLIIAIRKNDPKQYQFENKLIFESQELLIQTGIILMTSQDVNNQVTLERLIRLTPTNEQTFLFHKLHCIVKDIPIYNKTMLDNFISRMLSSNNEADKAIANKTLHFIQIPPAYDCKY